MAFWNAIFGKPAQQAVHHGVTWADPHRDERAAIYQVVYSDSTRAALDPAFLALDNSANLRPDWREYHPIRSFLRDQPLQEQRFYGFFSPKFSLKTALRGQQVHEFVERNRDADVVLFSPFIDLQALFTNSFVQGEYFHPGLLAIAEGFFGHAGLDVELQELVSDHRCSVFSNYFVAKPRFWREWLAVAEKLHGSAEQPGPLRKLLTAPAPYVDGERVEFKVFILERIADLVLSTQPGWSVAPYPDSRLSDLPIFRDDRELVLQANALKAAFRDSSDPAHMERYAALLKGRSIPPTWKVLREEYERRRKPAAA